MAAAVDCVEPMRADKIVQIYVKVHYNICYSCIDADQLDSLIFNHEHKSLLMFRRRSAMDELAGATIDADKVLVF
jgi:hypothetical protein